MTDLMDCGYFAYRMPREEGFTASCGSIKTGYHNDSFVIAPFNQDSNFKILSIIKEKRISIETLESALKNKIQCIATEERDWLSTPRTDHQKEIKEIRRQLAGRMNQKTVASRIIASDGSVCIVKSLYNLAQEFPDSLIFCFYTPQTGAWLGASPELLLSNHAATLHTYSLAGTRISGESKCWDIKNIEEQKIVTDYISKIFLAHGLQPKIGDCITRRAGTIEHLLTPIRAQMNSSTSIESLLYQLSPTPALCGIPKHQSMLTIQTYENFDRGYYGGFCGPFTNSDNFSLFVTIRSINFIINRWRMIVGGGITALSDPEEEWLETERKFNSIASNIIFH